MKKFLVFTFAICGLLNMSEAFAEPIVELAAPRSQSTKMVPDSNSAPKPTDSSQKTKVTKPKQTVKRYASSRGRKPSVIKVDYNKISDLIEYGYYEEAEKTLKNAINRNKNDIKAKALWTVLLAKQCKLDPAQEQLNILLKKYPTNADLHYAQGIVHYKRTTSSNMKYRSERNKYYNNALSEFKKAIELDKNNSRAMNAAGVVCLNINKQKEAKEYFKKAVEIDKAYSTAIDNSGTIDLQEGRIDEAESKFKKALTYNTQNTTAMYHLAQIAMQREDYAMALKYLNNALAINNNSAAIYNLMGKAYKAQGNEAAALNSFKKSLAVKPEFTLSYLDLAEIYEKRDDAEFAIEQLETAVSIDPNFYTAKIKIADISLANGKYAKSIKTYSELVGVEGYNSQALKGLANSYYGQAQVYSNKALLGSNKDLFKALECINRAIAANPQDLELHLAKLKLAKLTNQPELSKTELQNIIKTQSNDLLSNVIKGEAYIVLSDYLNAQKAFNEATKLSQTQEEKLYLSEIFLHHKQMDCAEKLLKEVIKEDPQNQEALNGFDYIQKNRKYADNNFKSAQYYLKARNYIAAIEYLSRTLAANPNNAEAHLILAELQEKQRDYRNAVINYKAYLGLGAKPSEIKKIQKKIKKLDSRL